LKADQVWNFVDFRAILYAVLDPDQVLHIADGALYLWQQEALLR
jgi:hypothetical protein